LPSRELRDKLKKSRADWSYAIEYCYNKNPKKCPKCKLEMDEHVIKSFQKYLILKDLKDNYILKNGYFYPDSTLTADDLSNWSRAGRLQLAALEFVRFLFFLSYPK
jgi:hypothetical protein